MVGKRNFLELAVLYAAGIAAHLILISSSKAEILAEVIHRHGKTKFAWNY